MTGFINSFTGDHYFLSNYYASPVEYEGTIYPTAEHAFQAAKSLNQHTRIMIANLPTPGDAKQMGRKIKLRPDWEEVKNTAMYNILKNKFSTKENRKLLFSTGDKMLIEGNNWHDNCWGSCACAKCGNKGENRLGRILVQLREELHEEEKH